MEKLVLVTGSEGSVGSHVASLKPTRGRAAFDIPSLDGIRAAAFLVVFLAHSGVPLPVPLPGGFGVTVFFFLSGYLITTLLRMELDASGRISLGAFYLRRTLRILPPFYIVLALAISLTLADLLPGRVLMKPLLAQMGHIVNFWTIYNGDQGIPVGTFVYWSLAVEEHFYLVFPWLFLALQYVFPRDHRRQGILLLSLCALPLAWRCVLSLHFHVPSYRTEIGSDTRMDSILLGCALALAANPALDPSSWSAKRWRNLFLPLGLLCLLFSFQYRGAWFRETFRYTIQGLALVPIFVVAIKQPAWGAFRLLNARPVRHIGALSYALYLLHHVGLHVMEYKAPTWSPWPRALVALAFAFGLAELIHRFVERPAASLRRRLLGGTQRTPERA